MTSPASEFFNRCSQSFSSRIMDEISANWRAAGLDQPATTPEVTGLAERMKLALSTLIRDRTVFAEDVEALLVVMRLLISLEQDAIASVRRVSSPRNFTPAARVDEAMVERACAAFDLAGWRVLGGDSRADFKANMRVALETAFAQATQKTSEAERSVVTNTAEDGTVRRAVMSTVTNREEQMASLGAQLMQSEITGHEDCPGCMACLEALPRPAERAAMPGFTPADVALLREACSRLKTSQLDAGRNLALRFEIAVTAAGTEVSDE